MTNLILKIASENPDGFTVRIDELKHVKSGIAVAYAETQNSFDLNGLEKVLKHAHQNGKTVGGWMDNGSYYFDSVRIFPDGQITEAIEFGIQNEQIAIFDITNMKEIRL